MGYRRIKTIVADSYKERDKLVNKFLEVINGHYTKIHFQQDNSGQLIAIIEYDLLGITKPENNK